ncbi:MAG TPA: SDR family oxidoreductase, partial [Streptosporangiaceae bacterium]|nr:SDR family oxidoreductase [Streptosporangiaceae bacterium]
PEDLAQTVKEVEAAGRRIVATVADVRDYDALKEALDDGVARLGRLDIVFANAGIASYGTLAELPEQTWQDMIDVDLTGEWHAAKAAIPHLRAGGRGGSIILTSSLAGLKGQQNLAHYVSAKHGLVGLMRTLALELAPDFIRVNSVHPTSVDTDMVQNAATYALFAPDLPEDQRTKETLAPRFEALDRHIVATVADVRDYDALKEALDDGVAQLGRLDIVSANAGIESYGRAEELAEQTWRDMIDVDLTGEWHAAKAAIPHLRAGGRGGSIILTSSDLGLKAAANQAHYVAANHGVIGLMRTLALELAADFIRVNALASTAVDTPMVMNSATYRLLRPDLENPTADDLAGPAAALNALPIPWVEPVDISNAVLWLASDEARYVTGVALPVDAGIVIK